MLRNNGKMIIGRNFIFCLCVICLMFTAFGLNVENSFAVELNETADEIDLESDDVLKLENSQDNENLGADFQDIQQDPQTITPNGNTYESIQEAINSAPEESTIKLSGTYYSNGNHTILVNKKLTITADKMATLDGQHSSISFYVHTNGAGTVIKNLKFINGEGDVGSSVYINSKNVRIEKCIFEDNHANHGGAVAARYDLEISSGLIVDSCEFRRNTVYYKDFNNFTAAPALSAYGRDTQIINCIFEDNWGKSREASYGGAIQVGLDKIGSNAKVIGCYFKNNHIYSIDSLSHGGAGCVRTGTSYVNCYFENNSADMGGALTFHTSGEIINCTFVDNVAREYGGALSTGYFEGPMVLDIVGCNFYGNAAPKGGAIQANGLNVHVVRSNFKDNTVTGSGGAIHISAQDVTIKDSVFNSNIANENGGAIYIQGKNTEVSNSTFISNEAIPDADKINQGLGGAIYVNSSQAYVKDNIFRFNTARNGSAIYYDRDGKRLTLENNELFQNQAWVYALPISAEDIYYGDSQKVTVTLFGGNNIGDFDNLAVSNAIYNDAANQNIVIDGQYPFPGARNDGNLYQDSREYNINVLLTIRHEDGTEIYNDMGYTNYLGEIAVDLNGLKPGKYYVSAKHFEDTYYKAIDNETTFLVKAKADLEIAKSVSKANPNYEDVITWTISLTNHGPNGASNVTVYDVIPEGLIWINDTSKGRYDHSTGVLKVDDLDVGKTYSFDIITVVNKTGDIINRANVTSDVFDDNNTNNFAEKGISVSPASDLALVKSVSNTQPNYKDRITWTIEITNNGPDEAHNISVSDLLSGSLIYTGSDGDYDESTGIWNVGSLKSGKKAKLNIYCIVNSTGLIYNIASVNASEYDYDLTNNNDTEMIFARNSSDLAIVKTVNSSNVNYGDFVKWTLTISNNGPDAATNIRVADILPEGFNYINSTLKYDDGTFSIEKLDSGKEIVIEIVTQVETTGKFSNYANVTCDEYDFDLTNNEDEIEIFVNPACDLSVTKSVSDLNPQFNDIITWTIQIVNNGPDEAHNVTVRDLLPANLTWIEDDSSGEYDPATGILIIDELGVDESFELNIDCRVSGTGLIKNEVFVNATEYDYSPDNNFDNATIDVEKSADVSVVKSVSNSSPNYNDLVVWALEISNNGPDKATDVYVDDPLPDGLVLVNYTATKGIYDNGRWVMCCLENGETQRIEIICRVAKTGKIINMASIHAHENDFNESNNEANRSIDVPPSCDLEVTVKANNTSPLFGENVMWTISIKNNGPDNATNVNLRDILPEELIYVDHTLGKRLYANDIWDIGSLNVGDEAILNIATITNALGVIVNEVSVNCSEYDWNMANNNDEEGIDVKPVADLSIAKLVNKDSPKYGETVKWTLIVANNGPNDASNVVVHDTLPKGLTFISSNGNYDGYNWIVGSLAVGEIKKLEIISKVTSTGHFINSASVSSDEHDPNESDNDASQSVSVSPSSDLSIVKIASKYNYKVGDVVEYIIEVVNNGPDSAHNIKVDEILSELLKLKSFKANKGKFNRFSHVWTIDELGNQESAVLYIKVIAMGSGTVRNTVNVSCDNYDWDMSNNKDYAVVKIAEKPLSKTPVSSKDGNKASLSPNKQKADLPDEMPSNLEMQPTAHPLIVLVLSCVFSIIFLGRNISKKR